MWLSFLLALREVQVPHCLLLFAIKAGDLLDLVILSRRLLAAVFNDQKLHTELIFQTSGLY